jgi:RHS repeat-associated protein
MSAGAANLDSVVGPHRFYDPTTGQFLTRDPINAITRSAYGYVYGNPLNMVDPSGLCGWTIRGTASCPTT